MIKQTKKYSPSFIITILLVTLYHIYLSVYYNVENQHDTWLHHWYLVRVMLRDFSLISSEYGIFYYLYVSIFSLITYPLFINEIISAKEGLYLTIKLSNIPLVILTIYFLYKTFKIIIKKDYLICLSILLFFSFSPIQRTFLMARPENLMILISVLIFYICFKPNLFSKAKIKYFLIFLFFLMITQKVTGFLFILLISSLFALFSNKSREILKIFSISIFFSLIYFLFHYKITGIPFYETSDVRMFGTDVVGIINTYAEFNILYKIDLIDAWQNPLRDNQWYSMWNILFLDLFGDYWNSGFYKGDPNIIKLYECKKNIARISIINSFLLILILCFVALNNLKSKMIIKSINHNHIIDLSVILFLSGIALFFPAALLRLPVETSSIFKWEYISFFIWPISAISYIYIENNEKNKISKLLLFILTFVTLIGFFQNLPFRC
tara:strand:- start:2161 stop:3474 length:1314 start_codon:yes stop_codon:yes gene_type:complete